jgi:arylsulfatase A-like enzyme
MKFIHYLFFFILPCGYCFSVDKPNIIFLFADDIRAEAIFEIEGDEVSTPNLDRLGRQGIRFTNAYSMGALSAPVCQASRAMVLTGRGVFEQEHRGMWIPERMTTLPEALGASGYQTFISGKWHNDSDSLYRSFQEGGTINGNPKPRQTEFSARNFETRERFQYQGIHTTDMIVNEAIDFMDAADEEDPFFMYLAFNAAHWPWEAPWRWMSQYDPKDMELTDSFRGRHPFNNGELGSNGTTTEVKYIPFPRDPAKVREIMAAHYAMISHMDDAIGRLLEALQERSLLENTIVVFSADNGLGLGQHGLLGKQNIYESGVRVPLLMAGPGVPGKQTSEALAYLYDIYPTLCDLAEVKTPQSVTGKSLKPVIEGRQEGIRESLLIVYKNYMRGFRMGPWKLHQYHVRGDRNELLFNVKDDSIENRNLAGDERYASVMRTLKTEMQKRMKELGDGVILSVPDWGVEEIPEHPFELEYWEKLEGGS